MSMQNDDASHHDNQWIPHSTIVDQMDKKGEKLNPSVELGSDEDKAKYIAEMSDLFHKKWKGAGNR
jgi:hypothetical protein